MKVRLRGVALRVLGSRNEAVRAQIHSHKHILSYNTRFLLVRTSPVNKGIFNFIYKPYVKYIHFYLQIYKVSHKQHYFGYNRVKTLFIIYSDVLGEMQHSIFRATLISVDRCHPEDGVLHPLRNFGPACR